MHAFDRQTDGQTDRQTDVLGQTDRNIIARPRLHCMQRGKNANINRTAKFHIPQVHIIEQSVNCPVQQQPPTKHVWEVVENISLDWTVT